MANYIPFSHFETGERQYHIYKLTNSVLAAYEHYHDYYQLLYVASGQIEHTHLGKQLLLGHGDAFIIPPGFTHRLSFAEKSEVYSVSFTSQLFHSGFSQSSIYRFLTKLSEHSTTEDGILLRIHLEDYQRDNIQSLTQNLMREQKFAENNPYSSAASLISASLYTIAQAYYENKSAKEPVRGRYKTNIDSCIEYIDEHFTENLTVDTLSQKFGFSKSILYELFVQNTGIPIKQYIRNKRILAAEKMIRTSPEMTFQEIASQLGYDEASTFYRNFTKVVGVSPTKYKDAYFGKNK